MIDPRFWSKVDSSAGPTACWPWIGGKSKGRHTIRGCYRVGGRRSSGGKVVYAHRWALILATAEATGESPEAIDEANRLLDACHDDEQCSTPLCCNPAHLFWGTHRENMRGYFARYGRQANGHFPPKCPRPRRPLLEEEVEFEPLG
jgi:hypothetical protein